MTPEAALETQIERYRQMTGEERLREGFRLNGLKWSLYRDRIRRNFPTFSETETSARLYEHRREMNRLYPT